MLESMRSLRKAKGLTMRELGERIGVAEVTISTYETGKREPSLDVLCKIADELDVSLDMLVRGKEKDRPVRRSMDSIFNEYMSLPQSGGSMPRQMMRPRCARYIPITFPPAPRQPRPAASR